MATRIQQLASNSTMYYRGDVCLEISPFTNYYMLTIYKESTDSSVDDSVPLNLTNLGRIYMSFINGGEKIRIPNYTLAEDVDMANGEVVFRISSENAERILNFGNHTFYISTMIGDEVSGSDETVLYSGQWNDYATAMQSSLTETITSLNGTITELNGKIASMTEAYENKISDLENEISVKQSEIDSLNTRISELETLLENYDSNYIDATIVSTENSNTINSNTMPVLPKEDYFHNVETSSEVLKQVSLSSYFNVK